MYVPTLFLEQLSVNPQATPSARLGQHLVESATLVSSPSGPSAPSDSISRLLSGTSEQTPRKWQLSYLIPADVVQNEGGLSSFCVSTECCQSPDQKSVVQEGFVTRTDPAWVSPMGCCREGRTAPSTCQQISTVAAARWPSSPAGCV